MQDEPNGPTSHAALTELRRTLTDGLARTRLNQTQLAARAQLGRTTVSEALSPSKPVPSAQTVAALARALRLPVPHLLELQRKAAAVLATVAPRGPGRPIGQWEPHDLEVHPTGPGRTASGSGTAAVRALPGYVRREHDRTLAEAVEEVAAGRSRIVVLVGSSSTGKTRACWEAVQPLAEQGWRLWHPFDPTRAQAALEDVQHVGPHTVVWLNEAQHYLGGRAFGEQIAAAVHRLLTTPQRGPVLVLGTLWPEYAHRYTALPAPGEPDSHSRVRELLAGRMVTVPDSFDPQALAKATALAEGGDRLLADALTRARVDGRVAQDLAGAPELLNRYQHAGPAARALLEAAMDARRLGVGPHLPQAFLTDAAPGYLTDTDYDQLTDDWAEAAYTELARPVHGKQTPLRRTTPRPPQRPPTPATAPAARGSRAAGPVFRIADYLEQYGRSARRGLCPPASFWHAAHSHLTHPDDLDCLTQAAEDRHRLQWAHHLRQRAADRGSTDALYRLALRRRDVEDREGAEADFRQAATHGHNRALYRLMDMLQEAGDHEGAETLARQQATRFGNTRALRHLAMRREEAGDFQRAESLTRQSLEHGDTGALLRLALIRDKAGDREGAETLARQHAARYGDTRALVYLATRRELTGDWAGGKALLHLAADHGSTDALNELMLRREAAGDREGAETLARRAVGQGDTGILVRLAEMREEAGDRVGAETLLRQASLHGSPQALYLRALRRNEAGDREGAEVLLRRAAAEGHNLAVHSLVAVLEEAGDRDGAEALARQAADHGDTGALNHLVRMREEAGDRESAETLAREAAAHGSTKILQELADMRERADDGNSAEAMLRLAADHGDAGALVRLANMRIQAGDGEGAEALARQAADHGDTRILYDHAAMWTLLNDLWPNGLDPDGTPTPLWQPPTPALPGRRTPLDKS
ncbi:AAA family ATPase [Streptomyces sp. NPDC005017]|uniref:AAA family ATPase n=1 Tax=Streptomyces sp. NPDC005017 TaxID=3364706 RepID=UPI0036A1332B